MHLIALLICSLLLCFGDCSFFFPTNSAYGILAAIAVPLDLPHRNVFFSYNFEANYNLPATWGIPPIAAGVEDEDLFDIEVRQLQECSNCTSSTETTTKKPTKKKSKKTTTSAPSTTQSTSSSSNLNSTQEEAAHRERRSLLTRTHFYHILKHKFERSGFSGEPCLLRLICETNASSLGAINGVLGSLIHILFSPSTSMQERLPLVYYQAELDGAHDHCEHYATHCSVNILDFISAPLHEIISGLGK